MKKILFLLILCLMISKVNAQQPDLNKLLADSNVTGLQLAWFKNGKTTYQTAGFADTDKQIKVSENTMFQAASLSKVVLAYVTLELVKQKKFDLDKPLYDYFEYSRIKDDTEAQKITARIVLKHLTGFPNWGPNFGKATWETSSLKSDFTPGSKWRYSGEGFFYLQVTLERLLNKDFEAIAKEMVFEKLGMKNSTFVWNENLNDQSAYGHNKTGLQSTRSRFRRSNTAYTLLTTAKDYMLFLQELNKKQLTNLMSDTYPIYDAIDKPYELAKKISWGLGTGIYKNELGTNAWHWGDNGSFKAFFMIAPKQKEILVCFTNSSNGLKLMPVLCKAYFGPASWFTPPGWLE